jgi:hypothetical protein
MLFRIYRMKEPAREGFRSAAHTSGLAIAKPKDYEPAGDVEAASAYDAWKQLRGGDPELQTGDILEDESGSLLIAKYIGFERAQWWVPEPKPAPPPGETTAASDVAGYFSDRAR